MVPWRKAPGRISAEFHRGGRLGAAGVMVESAMDESLAGFRVVARS
jgi:hypothetical protein